MVEAIVKKIMTTGINKYAKLYNVPVEKVQIKVTNDPNGTVFYTMCNNFKEVEVVSFLQIMDKKMDIFQYEALANPLLKQSNDHPDSIRTVGLSRDRASSDCVEARSFSSSGLGPKNDSPQTRSQPATFYDHARLNTHRAAEPCHIVQPKLVNRLTNVCMAGRRGRRRRGRFSGNG